MAPSQRELGTQRRAAGAEGALRAALGHPAFAATAAVGVLLGFTWPLLVFDRPLYVVVSFFVIWALAIGLLYASSRAPENDGQSGASDAPPSEATLARRD